MSHPDHTRTTRQWKVWSNRRKFNSEIKEQAKREQQAKQEQQERDKYFRTSPIAAMSHLPDRNEVRIDWRRIIAKSRETGWWQMIWYRIKKLFGK